MRLHGKNARALFRLALLLAAAAIVLANRDIYARTPFSDSRGLQNPYSVCTDGEGARYVLDAGLTRVVKMDKNGGFVFELKGGSEHPDEFDTAVCMEALDETLYVAARESAGQGSRLLRYNAKTGECKTRALTANAGIVALKAFGGALYYAVDEGESASLYTFCESPSGENTALIEKFDLGGAEMNFCAIDAKNRALVFSTVTGDIYFAKNGETALLYDGSLSLESVESGSSAGRLDVWEGSVYFSDNVSRGLYAIVNGEKKPIMEETGPIFTRTACGGLCADENGLCVLTRAADGQSSVVFADYSGNVEAEFFGARYSPAQRAAIFALWGLLAALALWALSGLVIAIVKRARSGEKREKMSAQLKSTIVTGAFMLLVLASVAALLIPELRTSTNDLIKENISALSALSARLPIGDDIKALRSIDDYRSQSYERVEKELNTLLESVENSDMRYYYVVIVTDGKYMLAALDSTGDNSMFQLAPSPFEGSDTQIYNFGQGAQMSYDTTSDETGDWTFTVSPVRDSSGEIVAALEVGVDSSTMRRRNDSMIVSMLMGVMTVVVILFMTFSEQTALFEFLRARLSRDESARAASAPKLLRPLAFMIMLASSLQTAFVAILASRLYAPGVLFGLPEGLALAVPVSASLLTTSVSSAFGGAAIERFGVKRALLSGLGIIAASFAFIGLTLSFETLVLGRLLSGFGMGLCAVSLSALASAGESEQTRSEAFTGSNTGLTSGANVGIVLGSQLVGVVGYNGIYLIAAALVAVSAAFAFAFAPKKSDTARFMAKRAKSAMPVWSFIGNKSVWSFLLCVFFPYTVCSYFLYYFFPLFADAQGMTEAAIGRFYLLAALIVVSAGPRLTRFMVLRFGGKSTNLIGNVLYAAVFVWFALAPTIEMAVVAVILLSVLDSFCFSTQEMYFSMLEAAESYGAAKAMGIMNMAESAAQTSAPFLFGFALMLGTSGGILALGALNVVLLPVFLLLNGKKRGLRIKLPDSAQM